MFAPRSLPVTVRPLEPGHRHEPTRRRFLAAGAGLGAAGLLGGQVIGAAPALAAGRAGDPRPIPGGTQFLAPGNTEVFHVFAPGAGEPNTITDFNGFVGVADVQGTGTATYPDGSKETLLYDTDMRFMSGTYVGKDGQVYKGTFGFV